MGGQSHRRSRTTSNTWSFGSRQSRGTSTEKFVREKRAILARMSPASRSRSKWICYTGCCSMRYGKLYHGVWLETSPPSYRRPGTQRLLPQKLDEHSDGFATPSAGNTATLRRSVKWARAMVRPSLPPAIPANMLQMRRTRVCTQQVPKVQPLQDVHPIFGFLRLGTK